MATTLDENLARWVFASVAVFFNDIAAGLNLPLLVDGVDERDPNNMRVDHAELRVSGPVIKEVSNGVWRTWTDINILLTDRMTMTQEDAYGVVTWGSKFEQAMTQRIPIYKFGPNPGDDESLVGCLTQRKGSNESVRLFHFGQISKEDRIRQSVVDGRYEMYLKV